MSLTDLVLVANFGSTSGKFALYSMGNEELLASITAENIGKSNASFKAKIGDEVISLEGATSYEDATRKTLNVLLENEVISSVDDIGAVGYKTVHAGPKYAGTFELTDEVMTAMEESLPAVPIHTPLYRDGINGVRAVIPKAMHVGVFEPHAHVGMDEHVSTLPIPRKDREKLDIAKLGFHGSSFHYIREYIAENFGPQKMIVAHLGGSSSMAAINENGETVDVTMGFTPEDGLLMGTRGGRHVPYGLAQYIKVKKGFNDEELNDYLRDECGLKALSDGISDIGKLYQARGIQYGVCIDGEKVIAEYNEIIGKNLGDNGYVGDYREVTKRIQAAKKACMALEYDIAFHIGGFDTAALHGTNLIVFTGGGGERGAELRKGVMEILEKNNKWDFNPDYDANKWGLQDENKPDDSTATVPHRKIAYWDSAKEKLAAVVIPTNENIIVARETYKLFTQKNHNV